MRLQDASKLRLERARKVRGAAEIKWRKENRMEIVRHGDVILKPVEKIPQQAKTISESKKVTIALGEVTGHHHTLYGSIPAAISLKGFDDKRYLEVRERVYLRHQEHKELPVEIGKYEIIIERERDPFADAMRKVVD